MADPTCPHCKAKLDRVDSTWRSAFGVGKIYLISCPSCSRLLGVANEESKKN